jgi:hypothetical protein
MKTCPDCNGDGVVEKALTMNSSAQRGRDFVPDDDDGQAEAIKTRQPN